MLSKFITSLTFILVLSIFACQNTGITNNDESETIDPTPEIIKLEAQEGQHYQVLDFVIPKASFTRESYPIFIDGVEYSIFAFDPTALIFLIPELPVGSYTAEFKVDSDSYEFTLEVLESVVIEDLEQYFEEYIDIIQSDKEFQVGQEFDAAIQQFYQLTNEEKKAAVTFIAHNNELLENLIQELSTLNSETLAKLQACDWKCYVFQGTKIVVAGTAIASAAASSPVLGVAAAVLVGVDVGLSIFTGKRSYLLQKAKQAAVSALSFAIIPQIDFYGMIIDNAVIQLELNNDSQNNKAENKASLNIIADKQYTLRVSDIPFRTLNSADIKSPNAIISTFVEAYSSFKTAVNQYFELDLPDYNNETERRPIESLSQISLSTQSNTVKITEQTVGDGEIILVFDFVNAEATNSESFNLDLEYVYEDYTFNHSFSLTLEPQSDPEFVNVIFSNPSPNTNSGCINSWMTKRYQLSFIFKNATPAGGSIFIRTCWNNRSGCNSYFKVPINAESVTFSDNEYIFNNTWGYCWGGPNTVLADDYYYVSSSGETSPILTRTIPK